MGPKVSECGASLESIGVGPDAQKAVAVELLRFSDDGSLASLVKLKLYRRLVFKPSTVLSSKIVVKRRTIG